MLCSSVIQLNVPDDFLTSGKLQDVFCDTLRHSKRRGQKREPKTSPRGRGRGEVLREVNLSQMSNSLLEPNLNTQT